MRIKIIFICFFIVLCQTTHQKAYATQTNPVENSVQPGKSKIVKELRDIIIEQEMIRWENFLKKLNNKENTEKRKAKRREMKSRLG